MKVRVLGLVLICTLVTVSAVAQSSAGSGQNASPQSSSSSGIEPLQEPARQDFWDGEDPSLGALLMHPFATKAYVSRHVQPIRDRLSELEELTASNSKEIRDVDSRAQQGIRLASDKADMADQHATEAAGKAQTAHAMASAIDTRVTRDASLIGNLDQYKAGMQTEIRFHAGQIALSKSAKDALDQMTAPLQNQHGYIVEVQGFASGHGQSAIASSRRVADSIVRYLVFNHEIPAYRIYVLGMGNANGMKKGAGTWVEVSVMKNDVDQIARQ